MASLQILSIHLSADGATALGGVLYDSTQLEWILSAR